MAYPTNLQDILHFLLGRDGRQDDSWDVSRRGGVGLIHLWDEAKTGRLQPTEQEATDAVNDLVSVDGQLFSDWFAEHGGDPILTRRRKLREMLSSSKERVRISALATLTGKTKGQVIQAYMSAVSAGEGD